jgi:anthranilate synthase component II
MKILIIDNYDSFTYNLYHLVGACLIKTHTSEFTLDVVRNDQITLQKASEYDKIIISPGPGSPDNDEYFGICGKVILELGKTIPILGVCLGMQGIGYFFGAKVIKAPTPKHGKISKIITNGDSIFANIPKEFEVMRYHSLIVDKDSIPKDLQILATTNDEDSLVMGLKHRYYPIFGVQFHPESIKTNYGKQLITNFINI